MDNLEHNYDTLVAIISKSMPSNVFSQTVRVHSAAKLVEGFFLGIDSIHVLWRLTDGLHGLSADFLCAALSLKALFSKLFNPKPNEALNSNPGVGSDSSSTSSASSSEEDEPTEPQAVGAPIASWQEMWRVWLQNDRVRSVNLEDFLREYQAALSLDKGMSRRAAKTWRSDGAIPPRCVVWRFMRACKQEPLAEQLWQNEGTIVDTYRQELDLFCHWFAVAMASHGPRGSRRKYRAFHRRAKLKRDDKAEVEVARSPAIADAGQFFHLVQLQTRSVVVEGLLATRNLKVMMTSCWGQMRRVQGVQEPRVARALLRGHLGS